MQEYILAFLLSWQPHVGVCIAGDHVDRMAPAVMVTRDASQNVKWGLGYNGQLQLSVTKHWSLFKNFGASAGVSYLTHRTPVVSQLNVRLGAELGAFRVTHDSNGGLEPDNNTGINCGYVKFL